MESSEFLIAAIKLNAALLKNSWISSENNFIASFKKKLKGRFSAYVFRYSVCSQAEDIISKYELKKSKLA